MGVWEDLWVGRSGEANWILRGELGVYARENDHTF